MQIRIPEPCHENWNSMQPQGEGRHCDTCRKTVVDFTRMSDAGILDYFRSHSGICGRFNQFQLNRDLSRESVNHLPSWVYHAAACSILLLNTSNASGQDYPASAPDTLYPAQVQVSLPNPLKTKIITLYVNRRDSLLALISSIQIQMGEFQLIAPADSLERFRFHIPDSVSWQVMEIQAGMSDGTQRRILIPASGLQMSFHGIAEISLIRSGDSLAYIQPWLFPEYAPVPEIMGIPPMEPWHFEEIKLPEFTQMVTSGFVTIGDTILVQDPAPAQPLKKASAPVKTAPESKSGNILFLALLGTALAGIWMGIRSVLRKIHF